MSVFQPLFRFNTKMYKDENQAGNHRRARMNSLMGGVNPAHSNANRRCSCRGAAQKRTNPEKVRPFLARNHDTGLCRFHFGEEPRYFLAQTFGFRGQMDRCTMNV